MKGDQPKRHGTPPGTRTIVSPHHHHSATLLLLLLLLLLLPTIVPRIPSHRQIFTLSPIDQACPDGLLVLCQLQSALLPVWTRRAANPGPEPASPIRRSPGVFCAGTSIAVYCWAMLTEFKNNYTTFDPSLRFDPSPFAPQPHSPPESFSKQSASSNEPGNLGEPIPVDVHDDQLVAQNGGRSSSEEKDGTVPPKSRRKEQNRAAYVPSSSMIRASLETKLICRHQSTRISRTQRTPRARPAGESSQSRTSVQHTAGRQRTPKARAGQVHHRERDPARDFFLPPTPVVVVSAYQGRAHHHGPDEVHAYGLLLRAHPRGRTEPATPCDDVWGDGREAS